MAGLFLHHLSAAVNKKTQHQSSLWNEEASRFFLFLITVPEVSSAGSSHRALSSSMHFLAITEDLPTPHLQGWIWAVVDPDSKGE
jgi:hypothetical protein